MPGVSPEMTLVAVARCVPDPARISAVLSVSGFTPLIEKFAKHDVEAEFPVTCADTPTYKSPEAGTTTWIVGPGDPSRGA